MATLLIIILGTVLIQSSATVVGARPVVHARGVFAQEFHHALLTVLTLTLACVLGFAVQNYLLEPLALGFLRTPILLVMIALLFAGARYALARSNHAPPWPTVLAYATNHCALFGLALFGAFQMKNLGEALAYGAGAALALSVLNAAFGALRDRVEHSDVPFVFRGVPVALITAGLMALALFGFVGLVRN